MCRDVCLHISQTRKAAECFRAKPFRHGRQRQDSVEMGGGRTKAKQSSTAAATQTSSSNKNRFFLAIGFTSSIFKTLSAFDLHQ